MSVTTQAAILGSLVFNLNAIGLLSAHGRYKTLPKYLSEQNARRGITQIGCGRVPPAARVSTHCDTQVLSLGL
eukprot:m.232120 g.232120  ORF g.232120 m.232120 type:complete len:73 (-) comp15709_c0_seq1:2373-2591(-)